MRKRLKRRAVLSAEVNQRLLQYLSTPIGTIRVGRWTIEPRGPAWRVDSFTLPNEVGSRLRDHHQPRTERLLRESWRRHGPRILRDFGSRSDGTKPWGLLAYGEPKEAIR